MSKINIYYATGEYSSIEKCNTPVHESSIEKCNTRVHESSIEKCNTLIGGTAKLELFTSNTECTLNKGVRGSQGPQGQRGPQGPQGPQGPAGKCNIM